MEFKEEDFKLENEITWEDIINLLPKTIKIYENIFPRVYFFSYKGYTYNDAGFIFRNDTEKQIAFDIDFKTQYLIINALKKAKTTR